MSILSGLKNMIMKGGITGLDNRASGGISNMSGIISGESPNKDINAKELVTFNTSWVAICNQKNANTCSSIPLKLYYNNEDNRQLITPNRSLDRRQVKSINCVKAISEDINEIIAHPVLDLFKNVNDTMNYSDWCGLMFQYLGLIGNGYTEIIRGEDGLPVELRPLLGEYVIPIADNKASGNILYYVYKPEMEERVIAVEDILHFTQYAPGNTLIGRGDLENCLSAQERYTYYDNFEKYLGINNSRPDFAVNYEQPLNDKDMKDQYRQWNKRFNGARNAGKVVVTSGKMEIKQLGFSPKDLQYQIGRTWGLKEIAGAFGIPIALLQTENVNYANANAAFNQYLKLTIYPKISAFCNKLNETLIPMYDDNMFCWFEENYVTDPKEQIDNAIAALNAGIITRAEARSQIGLESDGLEGLEDTEEIIEEE